MRRIAILACAALCALLLIVLPLTFRASYAQADPTSVRQTLDAIINPRLTLTARGAAARTGTAQGIGTVTAQATYTYAFQTFQANQTLTVIALTNTLTPTPSPTFTASSTALNPTQMFQTLIADVNQRLTQTIQAQVGGTQTAAFRQTFEYIYFGTLGVTRTPSPVPTLTGTPTPTYTPTLDLTQFPQNSTSAFQTLISSVLTGTAVAQQTISAQQTLLAIIGGTLGFTPTPSITPTANETNIVETLEGRIKLSLSQTPAAMLAQTQTAVFEGTIQAITNLNATGTSAVIQSTLTAGLIRINAANAARLKQLQVIIAHSAAVRGVAFNGGGDLFATCGLDNTIRLWDTQSGAPLNIWSGLTDRTAIAFSNDGARVAATSSDGTIRLIDLGTRAEIGVLRGHTGAVLAIAFSPDSRYLASSGADRSVRLWDARTGNAVKVIGDLKDFVTPVSALAFNPSGTVLATGGQDAQIIFWELTSGVQIGRVRDIHRIADMAFSPDGNQIATVGNSSAISVWNVSNSARVLRINATGGQYNAVTYSPDGSVIAAGGQSTTVDLFNSQDGSSLGSLKGHTGPINGIAFSPDGARLLSASQDQTVRVWGLREIP